jgi:hypothetical protein
MSNPNPTNQHAGKSKLFRAALIAGASALALPASQALAQSTPSDDASSAPTEVVIRAQKLDAAQQTIQPDTGVSKYTLPAGLIEALPGGDNVGLNQVILQAPGVAQDSYGQLHVRGDHNNIQFRLNGIILPEGLSNFGQVLSPRYASSIQLNTGALPAEYGLRTAAVINITTRSGLDKGGTMSVYGGSHGDYEPSITYGGHSGNDTYFGSLSYQQNQLGIESPYNTSTPRHDRTSQVLGFGYYSHIIDDTSRVSLITGVSDQSFQLPNTPGLNSVDDGTGYTVNGISSFASDNLQSRQKETTDYVVASYLKSAGIFTGQVSLYARSSKLTYTPDWDAELAFNGVAQAADKKDTTFGLQAEGAWVLNSHHTLRAGLIASTEKATSATVSHVFMLDDDGNPTSDVPTVIDDHSDKTQNTWSLYAQDEWKPFDGFVLNYGLRYDKLQSYRTEDQLSPRINFVWTPQWAPSIGTTTIHGGYARYFTPPPFELIASNTQGKFAGTSFDISGQNDLPYAQRDNYYDIGIQQRFGRHFTIGIDSYERVARNLIDEGQFGAPIILTPFNYRYGRNKGTEFTFNYTDGPLTAYANLAIAKAQGMDLVSSQFNFAPDDIAYIANHFIYVDHDQTTSGSAGVTYRLGETTLALDAIYGSGLRTDSDIPNGARLPDYVQVNASVSHHLDWDGGMDVRFDIVNLADRAYEIRDGGGVGVGAPQWGPRRGVFVGLSKAF